MNATQPILVLLSALILAAPMKSTKGVADLLLWCTIMIIITKMRRKPLRTGYLSHMPAAGLHCWLGACALGPGILASNPTLPLTICVTLGKLSNLSEPRFLKLTGNKHRVYTSLCHCKGFLLCNYKACLCYRKD